MRAIPEKIDFSSFLAAVNAAIATGILCLFFSYGQNEYVNAYTVCLSLAFAAQNHFFLSVTKRGPDPFLLLLVMHALVFYEFRVATLLWDPWSTVLARNTFTAAHLDSGLLYVILANFVIFLGLIARPEDGYEPVSLRKGTKVSVRLFLPALLLALGISMEMGFKAFNRIKGYAGIVINPEILLLLSLVLMTLYYGVMSRRQKALLFLLVFAFVAHRTAIGSRSAVLTLAFYVFCAWLAVKGHVVFKRKLYAAFAAIVPLTAALFVLGTLIRVGYYSAPISLKYAVPYQAILDRIGYLDMGAEIAANNAKYSGVINFEHYFKSVVDSGLTPGFNVFDTPKAANALSYIYRDIPGISLKAVDAVYQSDLLTVYGETYVLFGPLAGLAAMFVFAFLFQKVYRLIPGDDPFRLAALRAFVLYAFYSYFLDSFGVDWFIVDTVRSVVPFLSLLYLFLHFVRRDAAGTSGELR